LSSKVPAVDIFREADRNAYRNILGLISQKKALEIFKDKLIPLFLNIFPFALLERNFLFWWDIHIPPQIPIVLEILGNEPIIN